MLHRIPHVRPSRHDQHIFMFLRYTFSGALAFNRDLKAWDVTKAQSLVGMVRLYLPIPTYTCPIF
jgi:hypothetical protein